MKILRIIPEGKSLVIGSDSVYFPKYEPPLEIVFRKDSIIGLHYTHKDTIWSIYLPWETFTVSIEYHKGLANPQVNFKKRKYGWDSKEIYAMGTKFIIGIQDFRKDSVIRKQFDGPKDIKKFIEEQKFIFSFKDYDVSEVKVSANPDKFLNSIKGSKKFQEISRTRVWSLANQQKSLKKYSSV